MSFTPTPEQEHAVELSHQVMKLKLSALAGSAKTSTCILIAEANKRPSLYLAFNKTMAEDAAGRFPDWVEVRTTHSLAYKVFGRKYAHKLSRPSGAYQNVGWTGSEVARLLHIPSQIIRSTGEIVTSTSIGACVVATVSNFEHSADTELSKKHVSLAAIPAKKQTREDFPKKKLQSEILKSAEILWRKRTDLHSPVLISHDTYLKLYQLSNPDLSQYEIIYLDEYQDTNPCVHAIAMQQTKSAMIAVGDQYQAIYCQPAGSMVTVVSNKYSRTKHTTYEKKDIADIVVGDVVATYGIGQSHLYKTGKTVTKKGSRLFSGNIVKVSVDDKKSSYTDDHLVVIKLGDFNCGKQVVYLMQKGNQFRIGVAPWKYKGGMFGAAQRASAEGANAMWVLGVHDKYSDALLHENLFSYKYGIPQVCFKDHSTNDKQVNGVKFWETYGDNVSQGVCLLSDLGLSVNHPLWQGKKGTMVCAKMRSSFVTQARNLIDGMLMAVMTPEDINNTVSHGRLGLEWWKPIKVEKEKVEDVQVFSIEVEDTHTYFCDDILTHNCFRGAVNAMKMLDWPESGLTKSFRFGQEVADLANEVLRDNDTGSYRTQMKGFEKLSTRVLSKMDWCDEEKKNTSPVTKIYRTNAHLISDAIEDIVAGKNVAIQIDIQNFIKCLESGVALMNGEKSKVKHDTFVGFDNWKEFKEEAEHSQECAKLLRLITGGEVGKILGTLRSYRAPKQYDTKYSTAHKMKGLEDDIIWLADDFPSPFDKQGNWTGLVQEEQNLLYVALTRAKRVLIKNSSIEEILCYHKDTKEGQSLTLGNVSVVKYEPYMNSDTLERAIDVETIRLGGRLLSDEDLFCEGDNLHPDDPHWQNMDMEFGGLPQ